MPTLRRVPLFLVSILISSAAAAEAQVTKDPQALAVLTQMAAATGWNPGSIPRDAVATGTVTRYRGDVQEALSVTVKARGARQHRTDLQAPVGQTSTIVNGDSAAAVKPDGNYFIPTHSAISMQPWCFPFFSDLTAAADPAVSLRYIGTETVAGQLAHRVEIKREPSASDPLRLVRRRAGQLTVWISASTFFPIRIEYVRIANDNPTAARPGIRIFSDYRAVNGLALPFHQEEFAGGQRLYALQLNSVNFNVGLSDADFALPSGQ